MGQPAIGEVPANELVEVESGTFDGRHYSILLETATAAAYLRAKAASGGMAVSAPLGGYRSNTDQEDLKAHPAAYGSSLPSSKIASAGHQTHGFGTCVDIGPGNAWMQAHCGDYGFVRESPAGENNHYRFKAPTWAPATPVNARSAKALTNVHSAPSLAAGVVSHLQPNDTEVDDGWVAGELVTQGGVTSRVWLKKGDRYVWLGAFTDVSTHDLANLVPNPVVGPPVVVATPVPDPVTPPAAPTTPAFVVDDEPVITRVDPSTLPNMQASASDTSTWVQQLFATIARTFVTGFGRKH